jgi:hypothetical protein
MNPSLRYASNSDHLAVTAGYAVMGEAAAHIVRMAKRTGTSCVFTLLPTKELAFKAKIEGDHVAQDEMYKALIKGETTRAAELRSRISKIPGASFVDVLTPLQVAIKGASDVYYPRGTDGHPRRAGHLVIADALYPHVHPLVSAKAK